MGIFDFLKNKNSSHTQQIDSIDERKTLCPNCNQKLLKIPGAKTKCPYCGDFIYVRTRTDNERVVVAKKEADKIDEAWRKKNGTQEAYLNEKTRFDDKKGLLKKKLGGTDPTGNDVLWRLLNEDLLKSAKREQWGLYKQTRIKMAKILEQENKLKDALRMYLGICYLEFNGAINMPLDQNKKVVYDSEGYFKPFEPRVYDINVGIVNDIKKIINKLNMEKSEVKKIYLDFANVLQRSTRAPLNPIDTFSELESKL